MSPKDPAGLTLPGRRAKPSKRLEVFPNHTPGRRYTVTLSTKEFTCLCPAYRFLPLVAAIFVTCLIVSQCLFKSAFEAAATPLTYAVVGFLKRTEQMDHCDRDTDFTPLRCR
jgi:hypothetical protein